MDRRSLDPHRLAMTPPARGALPSRSVAAGPARKLARSLALAASLGCALAACGGSNRSGAHDAGPGAADGALDDGASADAGEAVDAFVAPSCEPGTREGNPRGANGVTTPGGLDFDVRTPDDYDATVGHPLLVVYAPAGVTDPAQTEEYTGLTPPALARGYVVTYVNHVSPASSTDTDEAALVPSQVAQWWCIDMRRIYLTGHSDGGSMATIVALSPSTAPAAAIAPSAAGVNTDVLASVACRDPLPVMVLHSSGDTLFPLPEFGRGASDWWAMCNGCGALGAADADACAAYDGCPATAEVRYCEGTGPHGVWLGRNEQMLDFFDRFALDI